jgi:hypothetical protein
MLDKKILLILLLAGGTLVPAAAGEEGGDRWSLDRVKRSSAWFAAHNAAGLHHLPVEKVSIAEIFFDKGDGKFIDYYQSDDRRAWGARTESFFRLAPGVVVHGGIEYTNFLGKHAGGSIFIDPPSNPFDIVEQADSNRGTRTMERYALSGAVSARLHRGLRAGGKIDYQAANLAKHKDLRHKNTLLDMALSAGLAWRLSDRVEAGAAYLYRRVVEGVVLNIYGNTDRQYFSLVTFGAFLGRAELFGESGYTSRNTPLFNAFHGISLQLELTSRAGTRLFNEFTYRECDGYYGDRSSTSILHTTHSARLLEYRGRLSLTRHDALHLVELHAARETLQNHENIYRSETTPGESTVIVYYGKSKMLDRSATRVTLAYTARLGTLAGHPAWELEAAADYRDRVQTVSLYPFFREQSLRTVIARLAAARNLLLAARGDLLGLSLGLSGGTGTGAAYRDGLYATPSATQPPPKSADHYLYREHEYLTLPRLAGTLGCAYSRPLTDGTRLHVQLQGTLLRSLTRPAYLGGNTSRDFTLKLGCLF